MFAYDEVIRVPIVILVLFLVFGACTERLAVRPADDFSFEPESQMSWPVQGAIVSAFGDSSRPHHRGVDLAARPNDPVTAALGGRVDFVGSLPGYGNVIALTHSEHLITIYAHVAEPRVRPGDAVSRGQRIASIGPEGFVHYEVRHAKEAVDPETLIALAPNPLAGGAVDFSRSLSENEPAAERLLAGVLGSDSAPARQAPAVAAPPSAGIEVSETPPASPAENGQSGWEAFGVGAVLVGSNLLYFPTKLGYASAGALTGGLALVLARDFDVASAIWRPSLGGDYFVTESHVRGETPLRFFAQEPDSVETNSRATSSAARRSPSTR